MSKRKKDHVGDLDSVTPEMAGDTTRSNPERERIARRAYELYLERGCVHGHDEEDWYCAERELTAGRSREDA